MILVAVANVGRMSIDRDDARVQVRFRGDNVEPVDAELCGVTFAKAEEARGMMILLHGLIVTMHRLGNQRFERRERQRVEARWVDRRRSIGRGGVGSRRDGRAIIFQPLLDLVAEHRIELADRDPSALVDIACDQRNAQISLTLRIALTRGQFRNDRIEEFADA